MIIDIQKSIAYHIKDVLTLVSFCSISKNYFDYAFWKFKFEKDQLLLND